MIEPGTASILSVFFVLFLMAIGCPIYASLGITGVLGILALKGPYYALTVLKVSPYANTANYLLAVVPLFIIMGHFGFKAGISNDLYSIGRKWFSKLPGGLGIATFIASAGFGACCGSSVASAATMGAIAIPEMRALGYDRKLACGIVAASGTLAILIPPSVVSVFYASINDISAGAQLIAGLLPGVLSVLVYVIGLFFLTRIYPNLCPAPENYTWAERFASLKGVWGMALLFFLVIGGMYIGWFTPTEAASVGAFVALLMMLFGGRVEKGKMGENLKLCFLRHPPHELHGFHDPDRRRSLRQVSYPGPGAPGHIGLGGRPAGIAMDDRDGFFDRLHSPGNVHGYFLHARHHPAHHVSDRHHAIRFRSHLVRGSLRQDG